jgi:signal transduction histidine kinase
MNKLFSWLKPEFLLLAKVFLLGLSCFGFSWLLLSLHRQYTFFLLPFILFLVRDLYIMMRKAQIEVQDFAEAVRYRDFSRTFNIKDAPQEVKTLRSGFNDINSTVRFISRERETQYQYLQQILELVDIGILSFQVESGEQQWMNMAFKKMVDVPYLKNIQGLKKRDEPLFDEIMAIRPGESRIVNLQNDNRIVKAVMVCTIFQTEGLSNKLVAFQNINSALDETEARAWQKLLSVMTHEIMNSVAPISSLAATLKKIVAGNDESKIDEKADLELGLETIQRRSEGLLKFAETYRTLNKILKPNLEEVYIRDVFENLITLMQPTLDQKSIELDVILKEPKLTGNLDLNLVEQVMINLLVNATEAVKDQVNAKIILSAFNKNSRLFIRVTDNGHGIEPELIDKIFIPFFSTKKSGSGIGLSLCKQIMLLHKGNIQVHSILGEGTIFELIF